jgi:hypothetical protein
LNREKAPLAVLPEVLCPLPAASYGIQCTPSVSLSFPPGLQHPE